MNATQNTHVVTLSVVVRMDEMDGSAVESAEIIMAFVQDALDAVSADEFDVTVTDYYEEVK